MFKNPPLLLLVLSQSLSLLLALRGTTGVLVVTAAVTTGEAVVEEW